MSAKMKIDINIFIKAQECVKHNSNDKSIFRDEVRAAKKNLHQDHFIPASEDPVNNKPRVTIAAVFLTSFQTEIMKSVLKEAIGLKELSSKHRYVS